MRRLKLRSACESINFKINLQLIRVAFDLLLLFLIKIFKQQTKLFEGQNCKYSSHNTVFLAANRLPFLVGLEVVTVANPKTKKPAAVGKTKKRFCFAAVTSGGCCTI